MRKVELDAAIVKAVEVLEPLKTVFAGKVAIVYAPGPSLPNLIEDWQKSCPRIAVNDAWTLVPDVDILYGTDFGWWDFHKGVPAFKGVKIGYTKSKFDDVICVQGSGVSGYDHRLGWIRNGGNSGYGAAHLAVQLGAVEVALIGFDMQRVNGKAHFFGEHPSKIGGAPDYVGWIRNFNRLEQELKYRAKLTNLTPGSKLQVNRVPGPLLESYWRAGGAS